MVNVFYAYLKMMPVSIWLFYFYLLKIQYVRGVRIFANFQPTSMPQVHTQFVPQVMKKSCLLKPQRGPCRSGIEMYYFDPESQNCSIFRWGGCQGNGNRFETFEGCLGYCLSTVEHKSLKSRPQWCSLSFDYGFCFGSIERYYYDSLWKVCKTTIYSGCGGNRNNFYNLAQCEAVCLYGNGPVVLGGVKRGPSKKHIIINPTTATLPTQPEISVAVTINV